MTEFEPEAVQEVWISDGDAWFPNAAELCKRLGGDYIANADGTLYIGMAGKGEVTLADALKNERKKKPEDSNVVQLKP